MKQKADPRQNPLLNDFIADATFDFHGFLELTAHEIEYELRKFLEECTVQECKNVLVITGKGEKIRPQVNKLLRQNKLVKSYKVAGYFNGQSGAFEVTL